MKNADCEIIKTLHYNGWTVKKPSKRIACTTAMQQAVPVIMDVAFSCDYSLCVKKNRRTGGKAVYQTLQDMNVAGLLLAI